jgi:hypothetical protein
MIEKNFLEMLRMISITGDLKKTRGIRTNRSVYCRVYFWFLPSLRLCGIRMDSFYWQYSKDGWKMGLCVWQLSFGADMDGHLDGTRREGEG